MKFSLFALFTLKTILLDLFEKLCPLINNAKPVKLELVFFPACMCHGGRPITERVIMDRMSIFNEGDSQRRLIEPERWVDLVSLQLRML